MGQSEFTLLASRPALWSPAVSERGGGESWMHVCARTSAVRGVPLPTHFPTSLQPRQLDPVEVSAHIG